MVLEYPLFEPLLIVVERQIPVCGGLLHQRIACELVLGIDEFVGRECASALFALVAISALCMAARTFAFNIAVGKEFVSLFVVILLALELGKLVVVVEFAEKVACQLAMSGRCGARIDVERDAEALERILDKIVIAVYYILWGAAFLLGSYGYGYTVLIAATYQQHFFAAESQVAYIDVGGYIYTCQVTYVHRSVGIGQCCGDEGSFEFLVHLLYCCC